jgi:hypothetical protein
MRRVQDELGDDAYESAARKAGAMAKASTRAVRRSPGSSSSSSFTVTTVSRQAARLRGARRRGAVLTERRVLVQPGGHMATIGDEPGVPWGGGLSNGNRRGDLSEVRRCGAMTRPTACAQPAMRTRRRCRLHGGKGTGPRTAGRARGEWSRAVDARRVFAGTRNNSWPTTAADGRSARHRTRRRCVTESAKGGRPNAVKRQEKLTPFRH